MSIKLGTTDISAIYKGSVAVTAIYKGVISVWASGFNPKLLFSSGELGALYDISDFSTLFQDTAGATPVTTVGQTVKRVNDKSGNAVAITNSTGWVLSQDGTGYYLQTDGASAFSGSISGITAYPATLVGAAKSDVTTNSLNLISLYQDDTTYKSLYNYVGGQWAVNDRTASAQNANAETSGTNATSHVGVGTFTLSLVDLILDGINASAAAANTNAFGSPNSIYVGKTFAAGNYYVGRVYALLVINRLLTLSERKSLENWMAGKSGKPYDLLNGYIAEGDSITQGYYATGLNGYAQ